MMRALYEKGGFSDRFSPLSSDADVELLFASNVSSTSSSWSESLSTCGLLSFKAESLLFSSEKKDDEKSAIVSNHDSSIVHICMYCTHTWRLLDPGEHAVYTEVADPGRCESLSFLLHDSVWHKVLTRDVTGNVSKHRFNDIYTNWTMRCTPTSTNQKPHVAQHEQIHTSSTSSC